MVFTRHWDASTIPRVWDQWEENGVKWVIQDLPPEDDEAALQLMVENFVADEALCSTNNILGDPESLSSIINSWRGCIVKRMSLGCYTEIKGKMTLVALNICLVATIADGPPNDPLIGAPWKNVFRAYEYLVKKNDPFKFLGLDLFLNAFGLCVKREYRGNRLGSRILAAREPLCHAHGIKATATMFSVPASQISAARCGFQDMTVVSFKELAESGLVYPLDENKRIKMMYKRYDGK